MRYGEVRGRPEDIAAFATVDPQEVAAASRPTAPRRLDLRPEDVERGPTQLVLKGEEDIRRLPGTRASLLITSGHGIVFRVRDLTAMDRHSKRLLERFL